MQPATPRWRLGAIPGWLLLLAGPSCLTAQIGVFESHGDIGSVLHSGSAEYDAAKAAYTLSGSGENMWFKEDDFQFVWKKVSGDITLTADIAFVGSSAQGHRKAVLMIRQSLDADSAYADVARHGDGLTSLQSREEKGATTHEIQSNFSGPTRLRLERRGGYVYMWLPGDGGELQMAGGPMRLRLEEPFYAGIGVCSHNKEAVETAVFSKLELAAVKTASQPARFNTLETITVSSTDRRVVYISSDRIEAPTWAPGGTSLLFNGNGKMMRVPVAGGQADVLPAGSAAYWTSGHGISPDGKIIVYAGQRDGKTDIYSVPAAGGEKTRLTASAGSNESPEYSPDGKHIYFSSDRSGAMQIWRMSPDGTEQEAVTTGEPSNWFPHISPDGERLVFLSYEKDATRDPRHQNVQLRMMTLGDGKITVLAKIIGGQGTMEAPCWSPDGKRLAFVSASEP